MDTPLVNDIDAAQLPAEERVNWRSLRLLASWPEKRRQARLPIVKSSLTPTRGPPVELNLKESPLTPGREVKVNVHVEPTEKTAACPKMPGSDLGHGHARLRELLSKAAFLKSPAKLDGRTLEREPLSQVDKGLRFHRSNVCFSGGA